MTKVLEKTDKVTTINLQNPKSEVMPGFCDKIGKLKAMRSRSRDLECPPTTLPTCYQCSRYLPGCTVLECRRLKADRPVLRVVQVSAEATARNSCPSVKARSTFNSSSRMTSRREDVKQRTGSIDVCSRNQIANKFILLPASYILKSQDCTDNSVALTDEIPIEAVSTAILEIDRGEKQPDEDAISKIYCPISKKILEISYCDNRSCNQPVILIECAATPCKESLTRVIRCSTHTDVSSQKSEVTDSSSDCESACPEQKIDLSSEIKDPFSQITCLDSSEISSSSKKSLKRFKTRICSANYCQPVRQSAIKENFCEDFLHAKSSASDATSSSSTFIGTDDEQSLDEQQLQRPASERMLRTEIARAESAKSDKAAACQRSATAFRRACLTPGRISGDKSCLSGSQEFLARYKEHIPIHQLERYEICRSKRNGLQDECVLPPFLQTVLKKEEQRRTLDNCVERKRNIDRSDVDRDGMSESMNQDQTEVLLYLE